MRLDGDMQDRKTQKERDLTAKKKVLKQKYAQQLKQLEEKEEELQQTKDQKVGREGNM